MDTIVGVIVETLLEGVLGITIRNPEIRIRTKTVVALIISQVIPGLMLVSGISAILRNNISGGVVILVMAVALSALFVAGVITNHKRGWKQIED